MAQYSTKSFSSANQVNTLKTSCNSLGRDTGKKLKEIATDLEIVSSALEYVASDCITIIWKKLIDYIEMPGLK